MSTLRLESQSSAGLRMQPYPRAPDLVWPGHLHGTGCLSARAMDTGFPTAVWCLCLGPGCSWIWVSVTPPALAGVLGGCVWVRFVVSPLFFPLGFAVFAVGVGFRPAPLLSCVRFWDVRAPPAPRRSRFWCAVRACVLRSWFRPRPASPCRGVAGVCVRSCVCPACPRPPWGAARGAGVCGCCRWRGVPPPPPLWFFFCFVVSVAGCPSLGSRGLCPPIPSLPGRVVWCLCVSFFAWCVSACFGCPFSRWAAALGLVLPVLSGWSPSAPPGGPVLGAVWVGGLAAYCGVGGRRGGCGPFSRPPPLFFFWGWSACSSLCLPWAGARTGRHSVWFSGLLLVGAFCQAVPRPHGSGGLCTRWARRPFLPG